MTESGANSGDEYSVASSRRSAIALIVGLGVPILCIAVYATMQRGPVRSFDCWWTDDFFVSADHNMRLDDFRSSVKEQTRNCVTVHVVDGPTTADAIVTISSTPKWILYRGDYTLEVSTAPASP